MITAMSDLEKYINEEDSMEALVKVALIHYQFETIHPFLDGNGRIGRLLISLFLKERKILSHEILYISYFFKRNRIEYYDRLMDLGILKQTENVRRSRVFAYEDYLQILRKDTEIT